MDAHLGGVFTVLSVKPPSDYRTFTQLRLAEVGWNWDAEWFDPYVKCPRRKA